MSNQVATTNTTALAIQDEQDNFNEKQVAALRQMGVANASPADVAVFFHYCKQTGLDPFRREVYMIGRQGKQTIQTGIDGFYKVAERVTRSTGGSWGISETYWCGEDGEWKDVWLAKAPPAAAKVIVERNGSKFTTVALTSEYQASGPMWKKMPSRMIAKCAEALAIRKAFPEDLSGLYTSDEMASADSNPVTVTQVPSEPTNAPQAPSSPAQDTPGRDWVADMEAATSRDELKAIFDAGLPKALWGVMKEHKDRIEQAAAAEVMQGQLGAEAIVDADIVEEQA